MAEVVRLAASLDGPPGAPVVVLGNSVGTTRALWQRPASVLRREFRLLRFEHRGHGTGPAGSETRSPAPPGPYTIAELGRDVLALLDAEGIDRALYCGISLGGMIGMWLAAHAPDRIAGLGLVCTSAWLPPAALWTGRAGQVRADGMGSIAGQVIGRWFTAAFQAAHPAAVSAYRADFEGIIPEGYAGCCEAISAMDLRPDLASITAPTLVIAGAEDPATPPWHGARIAAAIAGSRLAVIRGASHLPSASDPGPVTDALLAQLRATA
ncbi:MAG TPA: 3-oxoadipate enol-lactonase [Streptosporangiaceae bacterium]